MQWSSWSKNLQQTYTYYINSSSTYNHSLHRRFFLVANSLQAQTTTQHYSKNKRKRSIRRKIHSFLIMHKSSLYVGQRKVLSKWFWSILLQNVLQVKTRDEHAKRGMHGNAATLDAITAWPARRRVIASRLLQWDTPLLVDVLWNRHPTLLDSDTENYFICPQLVG